jgi:diaminohydroxyphosphoribosylaminopyrimidine deaminase/5-amino-6-(5-phosphoribosylamino)uracil reductase
MTNAADYVFMARALQLAERGMYTADPNPRVGCVLVRDGEIVGEGWHCRAGEAHAEVHALRQAGERARGADVYVTLEPCCHHGRTPPCSDALIAAGVARVVAAAADPNPRVAGEGMKQLARAGITVETGLLQGEAERLNRGFLQRMRGGRPWVRCKLAMSLDGRTALANGASQWITGETARRDVQYWRARSSAVMTGIGTVLADDPALTVRLQPPPSAEHGCGDAIRQPLRAVLDTSLRMPAQVMQILAKEGINEIWAEAGPTLSGALLRDGLVDELIIYMAPLLMGDMARGLFRLPAFERLSECVALEISEVRAVGRDWRITARVGKVRDSM